jgi:hypothetical protein
LVIRLKGYLINRINNNLPTDHGYSIHTSDDPVLAMNFKVRVAGYWLLDTGYWLLDTGCWILDAGFWLPVTWIWYRILIIRASSVPWL